MSLCYTGTDFLILEKRKENLFSDIKNNLFRFCYIKLCVIKPVLRGFVKH